MGLRSFIQQYLLSIHVISISGPWGYMMNSSRISVLPLAVYTLMRETVNEQVIKYVLFPVQCYGEKLGRVGIMFNDGERQQIGL